LKHGVEGVHENFSLVLVCAIFIITFRVNALLLVLINLFSLVNQLVEGCGDLDLGRLHRFVNLLFEGAFVEINRLLHLVVQSVLVLQVLILHGNVQGLALGLKTFSWNLGEGGGGVDLQVQVGPLCFPAVKIVSLFLLLRRFGGLEVRSEPALLEVLGDGVATAHVFNQGLSRAYQSRI